MSSLRRLLPLLLCAATALAAPTPKNVILMIGDGMGPGHVTLLRHLRGANARFAAMPVSAVMTTSCADHFVTDSAAGATALASGVKAIKRSLGRNAAGVPQKTVLDLAEQAGKSTGLVTTTKFFDATPAAFTVEAQDRYQYAKVIPQMFTRGVDVLAGTGAKWFADNSLTPLPAFATRVGYKLITTRAELDASTGMRLLAVFAEQARDVDVPEAPLPVLARWAIDHLSQDPDGFFLLIEHEGIDTTSHEHDTEGVEKSLISFDDAVGVALDFAKTHPDTLIVVTGDHETGSMRLVETETFTAQVEWGAKDHTAVAVDLFAAGPGAERFAGLLDNTDVGKRLMELVAKK